jgi:hypothetical protein
LNNENKPTNSNERVEGVTNSVHHRESMINNNPFDPFCRLIEKFVKLEEALKGGRDEAIFDSLSLFYRFCAGDGNQDVFGWREIFHKYDLIMLVPVSNNFPNKADRVKEIEYCSLIYSKSPEKGVSLNEFFKAEILNNYSVCKVIKAVSYNGGLHEASDDEELGELYKLLRENHGIFRPIIRQIAECLVCAYKPLYDGAKIDFKHLISSINIHQPAVIIENDQIFNKFSGNQFMQAKVDVNDRFGIRFCLKLSLEENKNRILFSYGHRIKSEFIIVCRQAGKQIKAQLKSANLKLNATIKSKNIGRKSFWLEVAYYPNGDFILAIDEVMSDKKSLPFAAKLSSGKFMIGSCLEGEGKESGHLKNNCVLIHSIDQNQNTAHLLSYALHRVPQFYSRNLPSILTSNRYIF